MPVITCDDCFIIGPDKGWWRLAVPASDHLGLDVEYRIEACRLWPSVRHLIGIRHSLLTPVEFLQHYAFDVFERFGEPVAPPEPTII